MHFEFSTSNRIIFGSGTLQEIGPIATELGRRALVVTGRDAERAAGLLEYLQQADITWITYSVQGEPTVDAIRTGTRLACEEACNLIIGFGGGSALDTGKAIAGLITNGEDPLDFLEVIGRGKPLTQPSIPYIAIPTTAGTGSEVTRNAVLASSEHRVKVSLRSPYLFPRIALIDPDLTLSTPPPITASTGLDALTQVLEPYLSSKANPLIDPLCIEGMKRAARSLLRAFEHGGDITARQDMALVSLFGGLALTNAGLGAVHGFAGPFGGMFNAPHGATCAALLPYVVRMNVRAMRERAQSHKVLPRFDNVAQILTGNPKANADHGIDWLLDLCQELQIPRLGTYGMRASDIPTLVEKASVASSMRTNPIQLNPDEMEEILHQAL